MLVGYVSKKWSIFFKLQAMSHSILHFITEDSRTLQLVVEVLEQNSDDLNDWEDERTKSQTACVIPDRQMGSISKQNFFDQDKKVKTAFLHFCEQIKGETHTKKNGQTLTWETCQGQRRLGRKACHRVWPLPSSRRQRRLPRSSGPVPWQSSHTRRTGRHCRTAGQLGTCDKQSLLRRMQKGTLSRGNPSSSRWWGNSERTVKHSWIKQYVFTKVVFIHHTNTFSVMAGKIYTVYSTLYYSFTLLVQTHI